MPAESLTTVQPELHTATEVDHRVEQDLNEIIPVLAHGLVRRIEQKGLSGKVRVQAFASETWGVAKSPGNSSDVPNVVIYPREALSGDRRLVNARLRHEIGNLNYPIETELNSLRGWCYENHIAPELLTSLVEATHEATVNYLEMRNSHSSNPEENFRALYDEEINTQQIADSIGESAPYKQAVDLTLLYSLSRVGLVPPEQFEQALKSSSPEVQEAFDKQAQSILDQAVKVAVPKHQVQLVRDYLWPKFSRLVPLSGTGQPDTETRESQDLKAEQISQELEAQTPQESPALGQLKEMQQRLQSVLDRMRQHPLPQQVAEQQKRNSEKRAAPSGEQSPAEQHEKEEAMELLAESMKDQLQQAKDRLNKQLAPESSSQPAAAEEPHSFQDIADQASDMQDQVEKAIQDSNQAGPEDQNLESQLEDLQEQLQQLEELAREMAESGELEEELAESEEDPISYKIHEVGIDETELSPEQLEQLQKIREFTQNTSRSYRTAMRILMAGYQRKNSNFTDKIVQKMKEHGYDMPVFSIYGTQAAKDFLSHQGFDADNFHGNFLVNFNLPRPLGRFWYKGGEGRQSQPVRLGEIEWGYLYRASMPIIYKAMDRAL